MAGKAYTMREMRNIVEYLNEHKAYGELKGRKMWIDFASSNRTTRTWQSLKEVFLKRILPDIHNPYYKLTIDQVRSFQQGYDVVEREKNNRLEFEPAEKDANAEDNNGISAAKNDNEAPTTSHENKEQDNINNASPTISINDELEKVTGEDNKAAKIPSRNRSSADTLVLEYENAEDVQRVLESPKPDTDTKTKSLKDMLTFENSAPLTPLVRDLLLDFETESEASDSEPRLKIDEDRSRTNNTESEVVVEDGLSHVKVENPPSDNDNLNNEADSTIEIHDTDQLDNTEVNGKKNETLVSKETNHDQIEDKSVNKNQTVDSQSDHNEHNNNNEADVHELNNKTMEQDDGITNTESILKDANAILTAESNAKTSDKSLETAKTNTVCTSIIANTGNSTQNSTSDTLLPNNQEALDDSKQETHKAQHDTTEEIADKTTCNKNKDKKRAPTNSTESKKQKLSDDASKEVNDDKASMPVIEIVDSPSQSILETNSINANTAITEVTNTNADNNTEEQFSTSVKQTQKNVKEPSSITDKNVNGNNAPEKITTIVDDKNPCLLSVSLFDEQFNNTKYSDSDSDVIKLKQNQDKPQVVTEILKEMKDIPQKAKDKVEAEVVPVKKMATVRVEKTKKADKNADSSADLEPPNQRVVKNTDINSSVNLQRERALANVFGFAHGQVTSGSRKRHLSHRRRSHHHRQRHSKNMDSNSSEWSSESDSEPYVSPPRARRNRPTRKYLKPKSSRILQDPDEGLMYVVFGKNIYPLVKDGKHIKTLLTFKPDSDSDEEESSSESFWKKKYFEEKNRAEEIKKLLKEQKSNAANIMEPSLPSTSRNSANTRSQPKSTQNSKDNVPPPMIENNPKAQDDKMVLKIAGKNGLEYCLEGGWKQISNAMPQVVRMMQSETTTDNGKKLVNRFDDQHKPDKTTQMEVSSGTSTPVIATVDVDVHEKVNKIETEIFNEIKNLDTQQVEDKDKQNETDTSNVTKRKQGRPRKEPLSAVTAKSPMKRAKSKTSSTDSKQDEPKTKRTSRTTVSIADINQEEKPVKTSEMKEEIPQSKKTAENKEASRRSSSRLSKQRETSAPKSSLERKAVDGTRVSGRQITTPKKYDTDSSVSSVKLRSAASKEMPNLRDFDDDNARYMFPPSKTNKKNTENKNRSLPEINVIPLQELGNSVDSSFGYQDSDPTPRKICLPKRKRKVSFTARNKYKNNNKNRHMSVRRSCPVFLEGPSSDSNNSSYFIPLRKSLSSLNSEVYRSESLLLMLNRKQSSKKLERIDENDSVLAKFDPDTRHFESISKNKSSDNSGIIVEVGSSSNVSLPLSPEISVVDKMSISREMIKEGQDVDYPTINEAQLNVNNRLMDYSEYMISNLDVSVPLMNQRCRLQKSSRGETTKKNASQSDSIQLKDCTVNLTLSESLDRRLRELLLESSKKPKQTDKETPMEVDQTIPTAKKSRVRKQKENIAMDVDESKITTKKPRAKKRSSTPRKKKTAPKAKVPQDAIIEEEHVESCTAGRRSCPPVVTFVPVDENANNSSDVTLNNPVKVNAKKKKDTIKVKIQKPKGKSQPNENLRGKSVGNGSVTSIYTDSGINDTETISLLLKDSSVDLIHNHSETCLLANECIGSNSIEFVPTTPVSIISLSSPQQSEDSAFYKFLDNGLVLSEDTSNQDNMATEAITSGNIFENPEARYYSPFNSISSLITEDLSNSPPTQSSKWYLLDEDITSVESASHQAGFGSNLKEIFPITCAVPNLSTITETSKDNEDSRKASGNS